MMCIVSVELRSPLRLAGSKPNANRLSAPPDYLAQPVLSVVLSKSQIEPAWHLGGYVRYDLGTVLRNI